METNFNKPNPKKILGYLMALVMVFFANTTFAQTSTIGACSDFVAGPNANWTHVLVATTPADGAASQAAQTFTMNVTALPASGANVRVYKTTANGNDFFASPVALTLGSNSITVAAVSFDRAVKFQFSDGTVEFDALDLNGVASACLVPAPPSSASLISDCGDFSAGPAAWPYVLTAATIADGASSQAAQTFTMNVTALPASGANVRVFKTTANGSSFFGNAVALTLGANSITVSAVAFDRAVKFQFSDGAVEFDALDVNGVVSACNNASTPVPGCTDALACNYDASADTDDGSCTYAATGFDCAGNCLSGDQVTVTLYDSYGDGGGSITVDGNVLTNPGSSNSMTICVDLSTCVDVTYASTDSWSSENSWDVVDASGAVIASGANASGTVGNGCAVPGCTDPNASNYDASATIDDGSCTYPCADNAVTSAATDSWASENSFDITDCDGNILASGVPGYDACIVLPAAYSVNLYDSYGDGGGSVTIDGTTYTLATGSSESFQVGACPVYGCTDTTAANYDPLADTDDGSCTYGVPGCTDALACNYDSAATADDGSCTYAVAGYDCSGNCLSGSEVTLTLYDSFGDGGGSITINGTTYTLASGSSDSWTFCMDVSVCTDIIYAATDSWPSENSWDLSDASGSLASGADASGIIGNTPGFDCAGNCLTGDLVTVTLYDSFGDGGGQITVDGNVLTNSGSSNSMSICVDLSACTDVTYASTDSWPYENSWDITDASGTVIASGADASGNVGACAVYGCTDPAANNYDAAANTDDGSCVYCTDNWVTITCGGGSFQSEVSWILYNSAGTSVLTGGAGVFNAPFTQDICLPNDCYTVDMVDSWGDGWNGNVFDISMGGVSIGTATLATGSAGTVDISVGALCLVYGCTDPAANNYDAAANTDDGSCQYACTAAPYSENFDLGTGTWSNYGWVLDSYGTTSTGTGPSDDMTGGGNYMYYETSGAPAASVTMTSECLDISALASPCLSFNYHMLGSSIGSLHAIVNGDTVWTLSGDQGNVWNFAQVDLSAYSAVDVTIDLVATYGGSFTGDIAIDNVGVDECIAILGCTDPAAMNYDPSANTDDGSCSYCNGTMLTLTMNDSWGDGWNGNTWTATGTSTGTVYGPYTVASGTQAIEMVCMDDDCYDVVVDGGSFQSEVSWTVSDAAGTILASGGAPFADNFGVNTVCPVWGCIDSTALNYDAAADTDDGSCIFLCDLYVLTATVDATPSCNGAADGGATVSAPSMIDTLNTSNTFLWSDGQTTSSAVGLAAGTHTCTVTDATTGCSATISVTIDETPAIDPNATASAATVGQSNGSMVANPSGGTPCYNGAAGSLSGGPSGTQWGSVAFDLEANTDLALTSIDVPTMNGMGGVNVYYRDGSMSGYELDPNGWILAGSATVMANNIGDLTNVPVTIPVNGGNIVGIYCEGVGINVVFGAGATPAYSSVAFSNTDMNIWAGIAASAGPAGSAAAFAGDVTSYDWAGTVNYSLASYTYMWMDLTTGATSSTNSITGLGVGPVMVTITDCNGCTADTTIFGIEMDVYGCMDPNAANFNSAANIDDGSCDYLGCTDTLATNYDVVATIDDGSCTYSCTYYGYDDEMTITMTPDWFSAEISWTVLDANLDTVITSNTYANGGAIDIQAVCANNGCFFVHGYDTFGDGWGGGTLDITDGAGNTLVSMSLSASNFESALFSLGGANCTAGCTDTAAANYDALATIDDGSCLDTIYGCTDPLAANTTPYANVDDGSCVYCSDTYANVTVGGGSWQGEVTWELLASDGTSIAMGGAPYNNDLCLADDCYTLVMNDSFGDGWNGNDFVISDAGVVLTTQTLAAGSTDTVEFSIGSGVCTILGCTDPLAVNYNASANTDDGSCAYSCSAVPYCDNFDAGLSADWTNNGWTLDALGTPSGSTGPTDDITGGGNYMYFETSVPVAAGDQVSLSTTCLDISTLAAPSVGFYYHMYGASIGTLDVLVNGTNVWTMSGDQGNQWYYAQADLSAFVGSTNVTVEIVGTAAADASGFTVFWGDMAIDEVCVQEYQVLAGCTDPAATNYDPFANTDDGSCSYCTDNVIDMVMYDSWGDGWNGATYTVSDLSANVLGTGGLAAGVVASDELCLPNGCVEVVVGGGTFDGEISWELVDDAGTIVYAAGLPASGGGAGTYLVSIGGVACPVYGCTDSTALNYDPLADTDDGSCVLACTVAPYCENFDAGVPADWSNNGWTLDALGTGSFGTGPSDDITGGGNYMYYETSGLAAGTAPITLTSLCLDVSALTTPALSFYNHMYGATMGTLDVLVNGTNVWSMSGNQGDQWNWAQVDLSAYAGNTNITIEFVGTYGTSFTGDMAIDEVCVDEYQVIDGCTDPLAVNYDPLANSDDGSCSYCQDNNITVDVDGGSFQNEVSWTILASDGTVMATGGAPYNAVLCLPDDCYTVDMVDSWGDGWNGNSFIATDDAGNVVGLGTLPTGSTGSFDFSLGGVACPVYGCTDSLAVNYDAAADTDDGSCDYLGCTNPTATNYDANATIDDGSCVFGCTDNTVNVSAGGGSYDSEISWDIVDGSGNVVATGIAGATSTYCLVDDCYTVNMYDSYGDGWNGATITLDDGAGTVLATDGLASGSSGSFDIALGSAVCAVYGCTDPLATNYDPAANTDDGSCSYSGCTDPAADNYDANATTDDGSCIYPCSYYGLDEITVTLYDSYGDGGGQITVDGNVLTNTGSSNSMTICVDLSTCVDITYASTDSWSYENSWDVVDASGAVLATGADASGTVGVCVVLGCIDMTACNYDASANTDDGSCTYAAMYYDCAGNCINDTDGDGICDENEIPGCTDPAAFNYDANATDDDGSCVPVTLGCTDPAADNYFAGANTDDGSCIYAGCTDPAADNYDATATVDDGSCTYTTISGCTDPTADNYDATATVDDGSCTYPICDAKPTGLNVWDITDTRFRLGWDNMNTANCMVWKYNVRYRETGTTTWTTRSAGAGNGLCNFGLNNVEKLMINFNPNTTYDIRMRVLYCGADPATGWTGWTSTINVTLGDYCPDLTNVTVQTFNGQQNKAKFEWDTTGVYEFARLYTRVNVLGSPWTVQGGFGIYYPTFFKNIFTFTPGETYRVQANSFCSASLASYRGNLTPPVVWTQPGGSSKIEGGIAINNLDVYPNPSRDAFNVTFTSDDVQNLEVRVLNIVGEVVYTENLEQFVGEYTKAIDLAAYTKGVYFLEITTNDGVVNKKLILQ